MAEVMVSDCLSAVEAVCQPPIDDADISSMPRNYCWRGLSGMLRRPALRMHFYAVSDISRCNVSAADLYSTKLKSLER